MSRLPVNKPITYCVDEAAKQIGCNPALLAELRLMQQGPAHVVIGGEVRYRPESLKHWLSRGAAL